VPYTEQKITIDGIPDKLWDAAQEVQSGKVVLGTITSATDLTAAFRALWDAQNLYLLVSVIDDKLNATAIESYQNDGVEVFIDRKNDKAFSYAADDFHYRLLWNSTTVEEEHAGATTGVRVGQRAIPGGYMLETAIPWTTLGGTPPAASFMGLDVQVNDNDGQGREGKLAWYATTDNAWQTPSVFGTVKLVAKGALPVVPQADRAVSFAKRCLFHQTPASLLISIPAATTYRAEIVSATGKVISARRGSGSRVLLDTRQLASGIYLVQVEGSGWRRCERIEIR
jgi:oligosaccharide reducing-end xylanase